MRDGGIPLKIASAMIATALLTGCGAASGPAPPARSATPSSAPSTNPANTPVGTPSGTASPAPASAGPTAPTVRRADLINAFPPGADLGPGWSGPTEQGRGFAGINRIGGCPRFATLERKVSAGQPRTGALASYRHEDPDTVLNPIQMQIGVSTVAAAKRYLDLLRTVPTECPTGDVTRLPVRVSGAAPRGLGDDEFALRLTLDDGRATPFVLDTAYVRLGGLIVCVYGTPDQVDRFLPVLLTHARRTLAGRVPRL